MISESGLQNPESLRHLKALGFHGFLIGEALMRAPDPEAALRDLIAGAEDMKATMTSDTEALQV
jgi:indole-3-glycerol phosphate synthase